MSNYVERNNAIIKPLQQARALLVAAAELEAFPVSVPSSPFFVRILRVSAILKVDASKVREGIHNERLSKEVSHSSCILLGIPLKTWDRRQRISP